MLNLLFVCGKVIISLLKTLPPAKTLTWLAGFSWSPRLVLEGFGHFYYLARLVLAYSS